MRRFVPELPPKDIDDRIYRCLENLNNWAETAQSGFGSVSRGYAPDGSGRPIVRPGVTEHHDLGGRVPILAPSGSITDYNDDHSQYALLFGRPDGQYLYGSRAGSGGPWNPTGLCIGHAEDAEDNTYLTDVGVVTQDISAGHAVVVVVSSSFYHPTPAAAGEDTDWHLTMTNNGDANTWTKLKEWSHIEGTQTQRTVSVWYSVLDNAITAASTVLTVNMTISDGGSGSWKMTRKAMLGYAFNVGAGSTVTMVSATGSAQDDAKLMDALSRDEDGQILYLRGIGAFGSSVQDANEFLPTAGFTSFAPNGYADATENTDPSKYISSKGEFRVSTDGQTSEPTGDSWESAVYDFADVFLALRVDTPTNGLLNLGSINDPYAANILLQGSVITHNASLINFQDSGGSTTFSYIDGSDGSYHIDHGATAPGTGFHITAAPAANQTITYDMKTTSTASVLAGSAYDSSVTTGGWFDLTSDLFSGTTILQLKSVLPGPDLCTFAIVTGPVGVDFLLTEAKSLTFYTDNVPRFIIDEAGGNIAVESAGIDLLISKSSTAAPTTSNDTTEGYKVGSRWVDTTNQRDWIATDVTTSAAVWVETTGSGSGVTRAYVPAGVTVEVPDRHQILVSGLYEVEATGLLDLDAGGKLVVLKEVA